MAHAPYDAHGIAVGFMYVCGRSEITPSRSGDRTDIIHKRTFTQAHTHIDRVAVLTSVIFLCHEKYFIHLYMASVILHTNVFIPVKICVFQYTDIEIMRTNNEHFPSKRLYG